LKHAIQHQNVNPSRQQHTLRASTEVSTSHPLLENPDADSSSSITENDDGINSATLDNNDEVPGVEVYKDFVVTAIITDHITIDKIKFKYSPGMVTFVESLNIGLAMKKYSPTFEEFKAMCKKRASLTTSGKFIRGFTGVFMRLAVSKCRSQTMEPYL
jgi:hypothetical protein